CEPYKGTFCSKYLKGKNVYVKDRQQNVENKVATLIGILNRHVTDRCKEYVIPTLCNYIIPPCAKDSKKPRPIRFCRDDCEVLQNTVCKLEFHYAKQRFAKMLPDCSVLPGPGSPEYKTCIRVTMKGEDNQYCYNGTGEDYIGRLNVTKYGMPCLSWKSNDPVYKLSHNFCRNPRGQHEAPWCYVDKNTYEYCVIPKCSEASDAIMAVLILAFVSIIVYLKVQHRRSTLPNRDHSSSGSISKSTQSTLQQPSSDFKQSLIDDANQGKVKFLELLGEGGFAKVCKAALMRNETEYTDVRLAIKRLKPNVPPQVVENFKNEISVLMGLQDINVLCLVGVSAGEEPLFMVFEYFEDMDMHRYLNLHIPSPAQLQDDLRDDCMHDPDEVLFLDFALQVASGMAYLAENNFIHRDLAARNCFITEDNIVKISNLGIGSCRYPADYSWVHGSSLLPVRWMPPEALNSLHFTHRSDVWSFGVVLWEIYSYGRQPYSGYNNQEAIECIRNMQMLPCP
ncbi:predicted protein, partial [Nematostella vectensis]